MNVPEASATITGISGQSAPIEVTSSVRDAPAWVLILVALALVALAVVVFVGGRSSRRGAQARAPVPRFDPHGRRSG